MAKSRNNPGGATHQRATNSKPILVPLTPEQHRIIQLAAGTYTGTDRAVCRWAAVALEAAARARLDDVGIDASQTG